MAIRAETDITLTRVDDGSAGANGATFTPSVDIDGDISWTNDGGLPNPPTQNIMGPPGSSGVSVTSVKTQYYLSTSDSSATGGSWDDTPQTFVSGQYYWTRDYIDYSDGTHDTSTPVYNQGLTLANEYAITAKDSADDALSSASQAINQLGIVEDIVGVLDLIATNGVYALTQDTVVMPNKWYFTVTGTAVTNPSGNPYAQGWYELINSVYVLTEDTTVQVGTTYYTIEASPVAVPVDADIGTYYELVSIDSAIQNYISDHIAYTNGTLFLQNGLTRVALSTDANEGLTFYNNGQQVAQYGTDAVLGDPNGVHITITPDYNSSGIPRLSFYRNSVDEVAYISGDKLYITQSVVLQQMDVGTTVADGGLGQWSWKVHEVSGANNLYLKWLG